MLQLTIVMYRRYPGYEVKSTIALENVGITNDEYQEKLYALKHKLEQIIPGNYKNKYIISRDDMIIRTSVEKASEAQRALVKMEGYIKDAVNSLKLK